MKPRTTKSLDEPLVSSDTRASYVLVAEGDIVRSAAFLKALEPRRVGTLVARDGIEALQILERFGPPNLLVISLSLTRRDPFVVINALRSVADHRHAGIIALTSVGGLHRISSQVRKDLGISSVLPYTGGAAAFRAAVKKAFAETGAPAPIHSGHEARAASRLDVVGEILRDLTSRATRLIGAAGSVVYLQAKDLGCFHAYVDWLSDRGDAPSQFAAPYALEWVTRTGDVLVIPDYSTQSIFSRQTETLRDVVRALVATPLIGEKDRVVGALCVFDVRPLMITSPQLDALKALGREFGFLLESQDSLPVSMAGEVRSRGAVSTATPATVAVDSVTGLLTRESGLAVFTHETARAGDERRPISLILIAPDHFEAIEEALGRESSDRVLRTLTQTAKLMLRASDVAIRWGPDEILIVLPMVSVSTAREVAERLREAAQKIRLRDMPPLTVSGGLTELPPGTDPEKALERVREQLASARGGGGNRIY